MISKGRRRRAARRAVAGAAVVAVATGVGLVAALQPGSGPDRPAPPIAGVAPNAVLVAAAAPMATEAPDRFDPLRRTLSVGWIPSGLGEQGAETTPWQQSFGGKDAAWVNGGPDIGLFVTVLAKGRPVTDFTSGALGLPLDAVAQPTDPINGGAAECLTDPAVPGSCSAIRWRYAPDAWARVSYAGSAGPSPEQAAAVARRVAESVTLTDGEVVRMPFTLNGNLADMTVAGTFVSIHDTPGMHGETWSASVDLVPAGTAVQPMYGGQGLYVGASFVPGDPSARIERDEPPNTTVNGHPARLQADGSSVVVWGASGTRSYAGWHSNGGGDALAAYANVGLMPDPADPADWPPVN